MYEEIVELNQSGPQMQYQQTDSGWQQAINMGFSNSMNQPRGGDCQQGQMNMIGGIFSGWDDLMRKENIQSQKAPQTWKHRQEESWKVPLNMQQPPQVRDYTFPNPTVKYKIIPLLNDKMAFDVYT